MADKGKSGAGRKDVDTEMRKQAYGSRDGKAPMVPPVKDGDALTTDN